MGIKQSIYEKPGTLNYYKFNAKEYALVKKVWSGIEINPQFHGNACLRSFCETHPQYVKFFTQESKLHLNFDTRIMAKFSIIIETMGYLLLDFNKKPKQLDRLVGYIAMVHKDMRLDEQDMRNLVTSLFAYLSRTYPTHMTTECQEAMSKFMDSVVKELHVKMKTFRDYDVTQSGVGIRSKLPWGQCPLFAEPLIFGKSKLYWDEWKKQWDARLEEWAIQAITPIAEEPAELISFVNDEDTSASKSKDETGILQQKISELSPKLHNPDESASRLLLNLNETIVVDESPQRMQKRADKQCKPRYDSVQLPHSNSEAANPFASRERHRAKNFTRDVSNLQADAMTLSINCSAFGKTNICGDRGDDKEMIVQQESSEIAATKAYNTARERRRERFNVDLKL